MTSKNLLKIDATPDVNIYSKFAKSGASIEDCISELIDNSYDARTPKQIEGNTQLLIHIELSDKRFVIRDFASGMKLEDLRTCLALGKTKKSGAKLGKYGFGLKRVLPTLGDEITIRTKTGGTKANYMKLKFSKIRSFLDIESGELTDEMFPPPLKLNDFDVGTEIEVNCLNFSSEEINLDRVKRYLQLAYCPFIKEEQMLIKFNSEFLVPSERTLQPILSIMTEEDVKKYKYKVKNEQIQINFDIGKDSVKKVTGFVAFLDKRSTIGNRALTN